VRRVSPAPRVFASEQARAVASEKCRSPEKIRCSSAFQPRLPAKSKTRAAAWARAVADCRFVSQWIEGLRAVKASRDRRDVAALDCG
jgi:hypothetical protein